jgi:quinolinate synthase
MADMADPDQLETCWEELTQMGVTKGLRSSRTGVVPVTYINSAASIKAFVGERGGTVCTSSNAAATLKWAFERGDKVLFLPDQHLGRNTAYKMGIPLDEMVVWDPNEVFGGVDIDALLRAKMILWKGHCSVHVRFSAAQIEHLRKQHPGVRVIVHPEVPWDVVRRPTTAAARNTSSRREGEPGRIGLGRRDRGSPRQPTRERVAPDRTVCRSISSAASARRCSACRRTICCGFSKSSSKARAQPHRRSDEQKHWTKVALDRMLSIQ